MNCDQAELWMSRALDGELSRDQEGILNEHLERCPACRQVREQWLVSTRLMREHQVTVPQTPEAAWADVQRTIRLQGAARSAKIPLVFGWKLQWAAVMLVFVVMGLGWFLMKRAPTTQTAAAGARPAETTVVEMVESGLPGASTVVYEDNDSGMMVIWLLPSEEKEKKHVDS